MNNTGRKFKRFFVFLVSILAAIVTIGIIRIVGSTTVKEILLDSDATFWPFTVQNIMWVALFIGFGELFLRWSSANDEENQRKRGYLPTDGKMLTPEILQKIRGGIVNRKFGKSAFLPRMILRTIDQYTVSKKEDQAISVLNSSLELYMHEIDLRYAMMRYLTWLIPSLGFIGTVMGIMFALQYAGVPANAEAEDFLYQVTNRLGVAFTTTLVALVMSAIIVLIQSLVQGKEEQALNEAGQYCLDNLILRLGQGVQETTENPVARKEVVSKPIVNEDVAQTVEPIRENTQIQEKTPSKNTFSNSTWGDGDTNE